jgi:ABC-2 type transport system permease protein
VHKVLVICLREYFAVIRTTAFVIGLVLMPILMSGSLFVQRMLRDFHDTTPKHYAVIDRTPDQLGLRTVQAAVAFYNEHGRNDENGVKIKAPFEVADADRIALPDGSQDQVWEQREQLSTRVQKGELNGFLEVGAHVAEPVGRDATPEQKEDHGLRYQSNRPTDLDFSRLAEGAIGEAVRGLRAHAAGISPDTLDRVTQSVPLVPKGLSKRNPKTGDLEDGSEEGRFAGLIVPGVLMMLMFIMIVLGAQPLMQGVVEEKMQRIAEVLLGSVRPFELMLGKLLGMNAVALTMSAVYLGGAYWAAVQYGFAEYISASLLVWFVVFQVLSGLMFGSLFAAVGAACSDTKETQTMVWPVMLLVMMPLFMLGTVLTEPNSPVVTAASFFPFATPMLMVARIAVPPGVPAWQPWVGVVIVLATTFVCVWAAGRIFRVGLLMQGKGARPADLARWVLRG